MAAVVPGVHQSGTPPSPLVWWGGPVEPSSLYYAMLQNHHGSVITDNEMHSKLVITYAALVWIRLVVVSIMYVVGIMHVCTWYWLMCLLDFNVTASTHVGT